MRNEEQLLGFDSREMWSQMDATWPESRKALYLVRADVTKVLSVDSLVWPRVVLGVEKNMRAPTQWRAERLGLARTFSLISQVL
jgi:hypothetical protein